METEEIEFTEWIEDEMTKRGWTIRETARRAGLTHAAISNVLNDQRNPGWNFCVGIARAFGKPPEDVMRRAGLLPRLPAPKEHGEGTIQKLADLIYNLPIEVQEDLLAIAWSLYQRYRDSDDSD